jgi:hypothetical protein
MNSLDQKNERGELGLFLTSPNKSPRFFGAAGSTKEGDIIHIAQIGAKKLSYSESVKFILVMSIDLFKNNHWGPFQIGESIWNPDLRSSKTIPNLIHIYGYQKIMNVKIEASRTKSLDSLPFYEWRKIWDILGLIRDERIENRVKNPRISKEKFDDDILDAFLSRTISRVDAIINEELYKGYPSDNCHYLNF